MTERLTISLVDPVTEVDQLTSADLLCGLTATLEIALGTQVWRDQHFPVLELAVQLARTSFSVPLTFVSMCMEEAPVLATEQQDELLTLVTFDGARFDVTEADLRAALEDFVTRVDQVLRENVGWSLADVERSLS